MFRTLFTLGLLLPASLFAEDRQLTEYCKVGDVGHLGRHIESWKGMHHDNAATVRQVNDKGDVLMRHSYAITSRRWSEFVFVLRGVPEASKWRRGEVVVLPPKLKVTGWYEAKDGAGNVLPLQILEPVK